MSIIGKKHKVALDQLANSDVTTWKRALELVVKSAHVKFDESADVGTDENTPVVLGYRGKEDFSGKINKVEIELK